MKSTLDLDIALVVQKISPHFWIQKLEEDLQS